MPDWKIHIVWSHRLQDSTFEYSSENLARQHFEGFSKQISVKEATLINPKGKQVDHFIDNDLAEHAS